MGRINRDVIVALLLLAGCGAFFHASFQIEETNYGTIQSWVWPRIVLTALTGACLLLLGQALLRGAETVEKRRGGFLAWAGRYRNAAYVYGLFFLFLVTLPYLGMLLGGVLFVFVTLTVLGRPQASLVPLHLAIAIGSIGAMWAIFTFALRVILPQGVILPF
mgnify:CR=1 FL=1